MRSNLQFYKPLSCMSLVLNRYRRWKNNLTFNGTVHYRTVARKFSTGGLCGSASRLCVCAEGRTVARKFSIGGLRGSAGELCVCAGGGLTL